MSHRGRVAIIIVLQLLALGGVAASKQWTLSTGHVVLLETAPVDPRDLFRGNYVVLRYSISMVNRDIPGASGTYRIGDTVYVGLRRQGRFWVADSLHPIRPSPPFIRGEIASVRANTLLVHYGIESYFVPEGTGRRVETSSLRLSVEVALRKDGRGVIRRVFLGDEPI